MTLHRYCPLRPDWTVRHRNCHLFAGRLWLLSRYSRWLRYCIYSAFVNLKLVPALRLMDLGYSPHKVMSELAADDPQFNYRQVGIVNAENAIAVHTGSNTRPWAGHLTGEGYIVMGNVLAGEEVLQAMAETFEQQEQADLDERLLCSRSRPGCWRTGKRRWHSSERTIRRSYHPWIQGFRHIDLRVDANKGPWMNCAASMISTNLIPYYEMRHHCPLRHTGPGCLCVG